MLDDLIAGTELPRDFMAKIFQRLVHAGLLDQFARPHRGGFCLAKPAHEITILDIVNSLEDARPDRSLCCRPDRMQRSHGLPAA